MSCICIVGLGEETGKLRETCSYFLVAYFFPGSEVERSVVPAKMVNWSFSSVIVILLSPVCPSGPSMAGHARLDGRLWKIARLKHVFL